MAIDGWSVTLAHERAYDEVLDCESGRWITLREFLAGADYGDVVGARRMALETDVVEGRPRYVCPVCRSPMLLRSLPVRERSEQRFYFKHRSPGDECRGTGGLSANEISALKFMGAREGGELSFDVGESGVPRAYYFDYESAARRLREEQAAVLQSEMDARDNRLRDVMEQMVVSHGRYNTRAWQVVRSEFEARGFLLPERLGDDPHLWYLLQAGYSAKLGRPVGCRFEYLIQLANHLYDQQKPVLWVMYVLLKHYDRGQVFKANGDMREWKKRRHAYQHGWATEDPVFAPYRQFDDLLCFLFPAAADRLRASAGTAQQK